MGICSSVQKKTQKNNFHFKKTISPNQISNNTQSNTSPSSQKEKIMNQLSPKSNISNITNFITIKDTFLGRGGSGIIREGIDINGKKYAIKSIIKNDYMNIYYKREIEITLDLNNENIIKCYDIYEDNNYIHFILELCNGGDLFDYILNSKNGKLEENEAIDFLEQILKSLIYLHEEKKIIHRDIKPENIVIKIENGKKIIKLIDFGMSNYIMNNINFNNINFQNEQLGTLQYAAPEIYEGKEYSTKIDLWSLGVVLYNMIFGTQLFNGNGNSIKNEVLYKKIKFEKFQNPLIQKLAIGLLERNPEKRFNVNQALSMIKLIKNNELNFTIPSNFIPDIDNVLNLVNYDYECINDLRNIFIKILNQKNVDFIFNNIKKKFGNSKIEMNLLIDECLKIHYNDIELKYLIQFQKKIGEKKLKNNFIDLENFFRYIKESIIIISKIKDVKK